MDLSAILIVGFIVLGIYRLFELFVRRKERMAIIEKLGEQIKLSESNLPLFQPFENRSNGNWGLRISLLLIGVGIGLLGSFMIEAIILNGDWSDHDGYYLRVQDKMEVVYSAGVAIFGGIGLLAAYFIEQKQKKD